MASKHGSFSNLSVETRLSHLGRPHDPAMPFVNTPVVRASTILYEHLADMGTDNQKYSYGRRGTPTSESLEEVVSSLECAEGTVLAPSGLAAIAVAFLSFVKAGDHVLVTDTAYHPTREFIDRVLSRYGVTATYYDPLVGAGIADLIRPETRLIYMESPGSLTLEVQDVPAIVAAARARDIITIIDNTWATPVFFRPLALGVDVSLMAGTKYLVGHSDALIGTISAGPRAWSALKYTHGAMGMFTGPDDMYLTLRGMRTLAVRLDRHQDTAMKVATWLQGRADVAEVFYPALPAHPGHALWKRDFTGASGLFSFEMATPHAKPALSAMFDGLQLFGKGYSWGGYESLAIVAHLDGARTATRPSYRGPVIRLNIGLENADELIADLDEGFRRLHAAA